MGEDVWRAVFSATEGERYHAVPDAVSAASQLCPVIADAPSISIPVDVYKQEGASRQY